MPHHAPPPASSPPPEPLETGPDEAVLAFLEARRSPPLRSLAAPGPSADELARMLAIAARVPDHGRLVPWRFIVIEGDARREAGERLDRLYAARNPGLDPAKADMWTLYLTRAPTVVVIVSRADPAAKVPEWNQQLSAGAAGMALTIAATAMGFASQWLLKWPIRDPEAAALLGIGRNERAAGMFHIGRPSLIAPDRPRPAPESVVTHWSPDEA